MTTIAIDTNILFRVLVRDASDQWRIAAGLFETHHVVILPTVLLETEWVLRSIARLSREGIIDLFHTLLLSDAISPDPVAVKEAMAGYVGGMDFADAMHVSGAIGRGTFVTFDRDLVRRARKLMPNASVELAV